MSKKMLINTMHPEEARVAIVEDGRLIELDVEIEGSEQTRGNIYKGSVVRVEPGLQAAFVDIGLKKLGFLQVGELHPDFWQWREDIPEEQRKRRPRIQEVLRRGQEIIVQVEKGERDMKGAALTTYLSLPGRYMVLMPGSDSAGVSRKVESDSERKKLKEMASEMEIPEGVGYIMRTEALGKKKTDLSQDFQSLLKLHQDILAKAAKTKAPALIYQESGLVIRTIRDYFTAEIDEVLVDSPEVFKQAQAFFKRTMPKFENLVKLHQEKRPIFSKYQLEEQIDQIYEKKVLLKSGGSLVIEPTEALVSIDVNSGKSTGERGVEDTAFKTNVEAAEEVARQLRLRDLGGLIVIDFIDMRDKKHMSEVEKTLKNGLKADKARVTVGRISQFGMLEMSRQRIKQNLDQGSVLECPHCSGRGKVKSAESMALSFLRKVHGAAAKGTVAEVRGELPLEVAYYLLNRKKQELARIENDYDIEVTVKGKPSFLMNQIEVEHIKREKPLHADHFESLAEALPTQESADEQSAVARKPAAVVAALPVDDKGRKKRPRGKKLVVEEELPLSGDLFPVDEFFADETPETPEEEEPAVPPVASGEVEGALEGAKKKRRRRRKRGKGPSTETAEVAALVGAVTAEPAEQLVAADAAVAPGAVGGEASEGAKKKKRRRRKRAKGPAGEPVAVETAGELSPVMPQPLVEVPAPSGQPATEPAEKPRTPRRKKKPETTAVAAVAESVPVVAPAPTVAAPVKVSRPRKKAAVVAPQPEETTPAAPEMVAPKPKGRKKKTVAEEVVVVTAEPAAAVEAKPVKKRAPRAKKPSPE